MARANIDFRNLTHDEIVFRVLLQREGFRAGLNYAVLERALPKQIRKALEADWRSYIRDEGLEFDSAYQKAVRKHLPGVYYVIMAAEFLQKVPFHVALGHFLQPSETEWKQLAVDEDEVFELANRLAAEVRRRCVEQTRRAQETPKAPIVIIQKPVGPTRRCAFCRQLIPASEIAEHIDRKHINPPHLGGDQSTIVAKPVIPQPGPPVVVLQSKGSGPMWFERFGRHRCICCGHVPIPGDFYCYYCAPG